jgi:hypothetical protein
MNDSPERRRDPRTDRSNARERNGKNLSWLIPGRTLGNLNEGQFFRSIEYKSEAGDLLIVGVECFAEDSRDQLRADLQVQRSRRARLNLRVLLGGTIHDVAQVVGAGYAVSSTVGNTAVIVKLFRVFLLLPVTLSIGWYFSARQDVHRRTRVPVPVFAIVFFVLCLLNTAVPHLGISRIYEPAKAVLGEVSNWGLLIAISALGLGTTFSSISTLGGVTWRHFYRPRW